MLIGLAESRPSVFSPISTNDDSKRVPRIVTSSHKSCSGILLADDIVFSAAHCFNNTNEEVHVKINNQEVRAKQLFVNDGQLKRHDPLYDMAILILERKVMGRFSDISVGCGSKWLSGECTAYGYGITEDGETSKEVREVALNKATLKNETDKYFEVTYPTKAKTCKGDSGGPVICRLGKKSVVSGVVSRNFGPAGLSKVEYCIRSTGNGITTSYSIFEYIHQLPKAAKDYILGHVTFENCAL